MRKGCFGSGKAAAGVSNVLVQGKPISQCDGDTGIIVMETGWFRR